MSVLIEMSVLYVDRGEGQAQDFQTLGPTDQASIPNLVRLSEQLLQRLHNVHGQAAEGIVRPGARSADVGGTCAQDMHQRRSPPVVVRLPAGQVQAQRLHGNTVRLPGWPRQALLLQTVLRPAHRYTLVSTRRRWYWHFIKRGGAFVQHRISSDFYLYTEGTPRRATAYSLCTEIIVMFVITVPPRRRRYGNTLVTVGYLCSFILPVLKNVGHICTPACPPPGRHIEL